MAVKQKVENKAFFDEETADQAVIQSLLNEVRRLKMPIVKTTEGKYYRVDHEQEVTVDEVNAEVARLQVELASIEAVVAPEQTVAPATPEAPAEQPAPEQPAPPVAPEQPTQAVEQADTPADANVPDPNSVNLS